MPKSATNGERAPEDIPEPLPPARTRERRVHQLVLQAEALIEERIRKGTASPTETVAIIRLGTELERANIERVRMHTSYLKAQKEKAESEIVREDLFTKAMEHLTRYQGRDPDDAPNVQ